MKKVLFATTALVAFAGAAAAEVTISGDAEMGIIGGDASVNGVGIDLETQFHQTFDITFAGSGETDGGLTFGGSVDLSEAPGVEDATDDNGFTVFISGAYGTLTLGNTDGALDWAMTEAGNVGNPGSIADNETTHLGYLGAYGDGNYDGQILRYDYTFGAFGVAVSTELDDSGLYDDGYAIGLKYTLDLGATTVDLGGGYQTFTTDGSFALGDDDYLEIPVPAGIDTEIWGVSAAATFAGGFSAGIQYSDWDFDSGVDAQHWGIGAGYETGPIALHANYGEYDIDGPAESSGWAIAAAYDLGGGASVHLGYNDSEITDGVDSADLSTWSFGVAMSF